MDLKRVALESSMLLGDLVDNRNFPIFCTEGPMFVVAVSRLVYGSADLPVTLY